MISTRSARVKLSEIIPPAAAGAAGAAGETGRPAGTGAGRRRLSAGPPGGGEVSEGPGAGCGCMVEPGSGATFGLGSSCAMQSQTAPANMKAQAKTSGLENLFVIELRVFQDSGELGSRGRLGRFGTTRGTAAGAGCPGAAPGATWPGTAPGAAGPGRRGCPDCGAVGAAATGTFLK
jgi:hypothetical protein